MNYCRLIMAGNLTKDPDVTYTPSQTAIVKFGIAVNRTWKGQDGQDRKEVTFCDCKMFGPRAEALGKYFKKGNSIFLDGRLTQETWKAQDGSNRSRLVMTVDDWKFTESAAKPEPQNEAPEEQY